MQPLNVCELESLIYTVDIVQLHLTISYLNSFLQSVLLLLMFIEVIVVMARNDYHPRVLRALRPIFFINSQLMYAMRRWTLMMYHAFNNYVFLSIHKLESMTTEWKASCSWVYMCSYYKASHILIYPLYLNRVMKEIFKVFTTILDVILLLLFLIVIFSIFGNIKYCHLLSWVRSLTVCYRVMLNLIKLQTEIIVNTPVLMLQVKKLRTRVV